MSGSGCLDVAHPPPAPVGMTNGWARDSGGSGDGPGSAEFWDRSPPRQASSPLRCAPVRDDKRWARTQGWGPESRWSGLAGVCAPLMVREPPSTSRHAP